MSIEQVEFFAPGIPKPGGSKRAFYNRKTGRAMLVDDCKGNRAWRDTVAAFALEAHSGPPLDGPLRLAVHFLIPRPKGHYGTRGVLPSAPAYPTTRPDLTKLLRSTEDALTGILWRDDAQIVNQSITKEYCDERPGARIVLFRVAERKENP